MRKIMLVIVAVALAMVSCIAQVKEKKAKKDAKVKEKKEQNKTMVPVEPIPPTHASAIVYEFLRERIHDTTISNYLGGVFPAYLFNLPSYEPADSAGLMLWFCYNKAERKIFLALDKIKKYKVSNPPKATDITSDSLVMPKTLFYWTDTPDYARIKDHLTGTPFTGGVEKISRDKVIEYNGYFLDIKDASGKVYCKYGYSCFTNDSRAAYKNFFDSLPTNGYVKYYLAFEEAPKYATSNRIRVVLIACDKDGKKVSVTTLMGYGDDPTLIEESFPPPPPYDTK